MKMNSWLKYLLLLLLCGLELSASAQSNKIDKDMAKFFVGAWSGEGEFANGKKIEADVTFYLSVDSTSLISIYADRLPFRFKSALAMDIDGASGKFIAHMINNFTGLKDFTSDGWQGGKITLANQEDQKGKGTLYQHFIYEKIDNDHFKATYLYGMDSTKLKEGDHLIFTRAGENK
jgi:hypothetical protein